MPDEKFTQPPLGIPRPKETVQVESPPAWAIAIGEKLDKLKGTVGANHEIVMHAIDGLRSRVGTLEMWRSDSEERARKHSGGIQKVSVNDASQDAAIASLVVDMAVVKPAVEALQVTQTKQLAILEKLDKVAANPMVRRIAYAVGTAVLAWLGAKGLLR